MFCITHASQHVGSSWAHMWANVWVNYWTKLMVHVNKGNINVCVQFPRYWHISGKTNVAKKGIHYWI